MDNKNKPDIIQAADRALQILEALSEHGTLSLNELHKRINVNKASLLRLTHTLELRGYVDKHPGTGSYSLTTKTYEIGIRSLRSLDKFSLINSVLADLSAATGRIAQFSIEDRNQLLCLQSIGQKSPTFSIYTNVGIRSPLYCTSAGRAILSGCSSSEIMERWDSFDVKPLTEYTITDVHQFLEELSLVRQRHYAVDREENEYNVFCVGASVFDNTGTAIGAVSISGRTLSEEEETHIVGVLLPAVRLLSGYMGYVAPTSVY